MKKKYRIVEFNILTAVFAAIGGGFLFRSIDTGILQNYQIIIATSAYIIILVFLIIEGSRIEVLKETASEAILTKSNLESEIRDRSATTHLYSKSVEYSTEILREYSESTQEMASGKEKRKPEEIERVIIERVLKSLRTLFENDQKAIETVPYSSTHVKVALFDILTEDGKKYLHRYDSDYPRGVEPSQETQKVDIEKHKRCCHVIAYNDDKIEIIEDVPSEAQKELNVARWENLRHNQVKDYKSMVCASIVRGGKDSPSREVLGVLVVDTNRDRYFKENKNYKLYITNLLDPFRTLLTMAFDIPLLFKNINGNKN